MAEETGGEATLYEEIGIDLSVSEADSFATSLATTNTALDGLTRSLNALVTVIPDTNEKFDRLKQVFRDINTAMADSAAGVKRLEILTGAIDKLAKMPDITAKVADGVKVATSSILAMADAMERVDTTVKNFKNTATTSTGTIKRNVASTKAAAEGTVSPNAKRAFTDATKRVTALGSKGTWSKEKTAAELRTELIKVNDELIAAGDASAAALKGKISTEFVTVLIDAVKQGESGAHEAGFSMGAAIEAGMKAALGIHSPSTVAKALADNFVEATTDTILKQGTALENGGKFMGEQIKKGMLAALSEDEWKRKIAQDVGSIPGSGSNAPAALARVQREINPKLVQEALEKSMLATFDETVVTPALKNSIAKFAKDNALELSKAYYEGLTGASWVDDTRPTRARQPVPGAPRYAPQRNVGKNLAGPKLTLAAAQAGLDNVSGMSEADLKRELKDWNKKKAGQQSTFLQDLIETALYYENTTDAAQKAALADLNNSLQDVIEAAGGMAQVSESLRMLATGLNASVTGVRSTFEATEKADLGELMKAAAQARRGELSAADATRAIATHGPALVEAIVGKDKRPVYALDLEAATTGDAASGQSRIMQIGLTRLDEAGDKIKTVVEAFPRISREGLDTVIADLRDPSKSPWFQDYSQEAQEKFISGMRSSAEAGEDLQVSLQRLTAELESQPAGTIVAGHNVGNFDIGTVLRQQGYEMPANVQVVDTLDLAALFKLGDVGGRKLGDLFGQQVTNETLIKLLEGDQGYGEVVRNWQGEDEFKAKAFHVAASDAAFDLGLLIASLDAFSATILTAQASLRATDEVITGRRAETREAKARLAAMAQQQQQETEAQAAAPTGRLAAAVMAATATEAQVGAAEQKAAADFTVSKIAPNFGAELAGFSNQDLELLGQYKAYHGLLKLVRNRNLSGVNSAVQDVALRYILRGGSLEGTQALIQKHMTEFTESQAKFAAENLMALTELSGMRTAGAKTPSTSSTRITRAEGKEPGQVVPGSAIIEDAIMEWALANRERFDPDMGDDEIKDLVIAAMATVFKKNNWSGQGEYDAATVNEIVDWSLEELGFSSQGRFAPPEKKNYGDIVGNIVTRSTAVRGMRIGRPDAYDFATESYQKAVAAIMEDRPSGAIDSDDFVKNMAQFAPGQLAALYSPIRDKLPSSKGLPSVTQDFADELGTTIDKASIQALEIAYKAFDDIGINIQGLVDETLAQTKIIEDSGTAPQDRNAAKERIRSIWAEARGKLNDNLAGVTKAMSVMAPELGGMAGEEMKGFAQSLFEYRRRKAAKADSGPGFETIRTPEMERLSEIMSAPGDLNDRIVAIARFDGELRLGYSKRVAAAKAAQDPEAEQAWQVLSSRGGPGRLPTLDGLQKRFERRRAELRAIPTTDAAGRDKAWAALEDVQQDIDKILNSDVLMRRYKDYGDIIAGLKAGGDITPETQAQINELESLRHNIEQIDQIADPVLNAVARQQFELRSRASIVKDATIDQRIQEARAWEKRTIERFGSFNAFREAIARYEDATALTVRRLQPFLDEGTLEDAMGMQTGYTRATKGVGTIAKGVLGQMSVVDREQRAAYNLAISRGEVPQTTQPTTSYADYMRSKGAVRNRNLTKEQRAERRKLLEIVRGDWMERNGLYRGYADMRGGANEYGVNKRLYERRFIGAGARTQLSPTERRYVPSATGATYEAKRGLEEQRALLQNKISGMNGLDARIFDVSEDASLTEEMRKIALEALEAKRSRIRQEIARITALIASIGQDDATSEQVAEMVQRTNAAVRKGLTDLRSYAAVAGGENVSGSVLTDEPTVLEVVLYARKLWANRMRDLDAEVKATIDALRATDPTDVATATGLTQKLAALRSERESVPLARGKEGDTYEQYIQQAYERLAIRRAKYVQDQIPIVTQARAITTKQRLELGGKIASYEQQIEKLDAEIAKTAPGPEIEGMIRLRSAMYDQIAELDERLASGYRTPTSKLKMKNLRSGAWVAAGTGRVIMADRSAKTGANAPSRSEAGQGNIQSMDSFKAFIREKYKIVGDATKELSDEEWDSLDTEKASLRRIIIETRREMRQTPDATRNQLEEWRVLIRDSQVRMREITKRLMEDFLQTGSPKAMKRFGLKPAEWKPEALPAATDPVRGSPADDVRQEALAALRLLGHRRDALSKSLTAASDVDKERIEKDIEAIDKQIATQQARLDSARRSLKVKREGVPDLDTSRGEGPRSSVLQRLSDAAMRSKPEVAAAAPGMATKMSGMIASGVAAMMVTRTQEEFVGVRDELFSMLSAEAKEKISKITDPAERQQVATALSQAMFQWVKDVMAEAGKIVGGREFLQADEVAAAQAARAAAARANLAGKEPGQGVATLRTGGTIDVVKAAEQAAMLRETLGTKVALKGIFKREGNKQTGYTYTKREVSKIVDEGQTASAAFEQSKEALVMFLDNIDDIIAATTAELTKRGISGDKLDKILEPLRTVQAASTDIGRNLTQGDLAAEQGADTATVTSYVKTVTDNVIAINTGLQRAAAAMRKLDERAAAKAAKAAATPAPAPVSPAQMAADRLAAMGGAPPQQPPPVSPAAPAAAAAGGGASPATTAIPAVGSILNAVQQGAENAAITAARGVENNIATAAGNAAPPGLCPCTASIGDAATKIVDALRNLKVTGGTGGTRQPRAARPEEDLDALRTAVKQRTESVLRRQIEAGAKTLNTVIPGTPIEEEGFTEATVTNLARERDARIEAAKASIDAGKSRVAILDAEKAAYASMMTYVDENIRRERLLTGVIVEANDQIEARANITGDAMSQIDAILVSTMGHLRKSGIAPEKIRESIEAFDQLARSARDAVIDASVSPDRTNQSLGTFAGNEVRNLRDVSRKLVSVLQAEDERPLIRIGTEMIRGRGEMLRQLAAEITKVRKLDLGPAETAQLLAPLQQQIAKVTANLDLVGISASEAMGETGLATDVARRKIAILSDETRTLIQVQREQAQAAAKVAQAQGTPGFNTRTIGQIESFRARTNEIDRRVADMRTAGSPNLAEAEQIRRQVQALRAQAEADISAAEALPGKQAERWVAVNAALKPALHTFAQLKQQLDAISPSAEKTATDLQRLSEITRTVQEKISAAMLSTRERIGELGFTSSDKKKFANALNVDMLGIQGKVDAQVAAATAAAQAGNQNAFREAIFQLRGLGDQAVRTAESVNARIRKKLRIGERVDVSKSFAGMILDETEYYKKFLGDPAGWRRERMLQSAAKGSRFNQWRLRVELDTTRARVEMEQLADKARILFKVLTFPIVAPFKLLRGVLNLTSGAMERLKQTAINLSGDLVKVTRWAHNLSEALMLVPRAAIHVVGALLGIDRYVKSVIGNLGKMWNVLTYPVSGPARALTEIADILGVIGKRALALAGLGANRIFSFMGIGKKAPAVSQIDATSKASSKQQRMNAMSYGMLGAQAPPEGWFNPTIGRRWLGPKIGGFVDTALKAVPVGAGIALGQNIMNAMIHGMQNMMWQVQYTIRNIITSAFAGVTATEQLRTTLASLSMKELSSAGFEQSAQEMFGAAGPGRLGDFSGGAPGSTQLILMSANLDDVNERWKIANQLADEQYQWLTRIAKYSSFGRAPIAEGYAGLRNMGFTEVNARAIETAGVMYADAFSPGNKEMINTISTQLGQLFQTGVLKMEDLKPLSQTAMVDVRGYIANALFSDLWKTDRDAAKKKVAEALTDGQIGATEAVQAIVNGMVSDAQAMAGKAAGTLEGMFSTLGDIRQDLMARLMQPVSESLIKPLLELAINIGNATQLEEFLNGIGAAVKNISAGAIDALAKSIGTLLAAWQLLPADFREGLQTFLLVGAGVTAAAIGIQTLIIAINLLGSMFGGVAIYAIAFGGAIGSLTAAFQNNFMGLQTWTQGVFGGVIVAAQEAIDWIGQLTAAIMDVGEQRSLQVPAEGPPTQEGAARESAANSFGGWQDFVEADTQDLSALIDAPMTQLSQFLQWVADNFDAMTDAITGTVGGWLNALGGFIDGAIQTLLRLPEALATIAGNMMDWGSNIVNMLAQGMTAAVQTIVNALSVIGQVISDWLMPGSPPKLLPDLDKWGKGAADAYLEGWTLADFGLLNDLSGEIEKILALDEGALDPPQLKAIRAAVAQFVDSVTAGVPDTTPLTDIIRQIDKGGSVAEEILRLADAMTQAVLVARQLEKAQFDLDVITARYEARLRPLQNRLEAIQKAQQDTDLVDQAVEYQRVLDNPYATKKQKDAARLKMEELGLQKEISALEAEREAQTDPLENQIAALAEQKLLADRTLEITKARLGVETSIMEVMKQAAGAMSDAADAAEKAAEEAKAGAEKNLQFKQPELVVPEIKVPEGFGQIQGKFIAFQEGLKASWDEMTKSAEKLTKPVGELGDKFTALHDALQKGFTDGTFAPGNTTEGFIQNIGAAAKTARDNFSDLLGATQTMWQQFQTGAQYTPPTGFTGSILDSYPADTPNIFDRFANGLDASGLITKAQTEIGRFQTWLDTAIDWPQLQADIQVQIDEAVKLVSPDSVAKLANTIVDKLVELLNTIVIPNEELEQFKQNVAKGLGGVEFSGDDMGNLGKAMSIGLVAFFSAGPLVSVGTAIASGISSAFAVGGAAFGALAGVGGLAASAIAVGLLGALGVQSIGEGVADSGIGDLSNIIDREVAGIEKSATDFSAAASGIIKWIADQFNRADWFYVGAAAGASIEVGFTNLVIWIGKTIETMELGEAAKAAGTAAGEALAGALAGVILGGVYIGMNSDDMVDAIAKATTTVYRAATSFAVHLVWGLVRGLLEGMGVPKDWIDKATPTIDTYVEVAKVGVRMNTEPFQVAKEVVGELGRILNAPLNLPMTPDWDKEGVRAKAQMLSQEMAAEAQAALDARPLGPRTEVEAATSVGAAMGGDVVAAAKALLAANPLPPPAFDYEATAAVAKGAAAAYTTAFNEALYQRQTQGAGGEIDMEVVRAGRSAESFAQYLPDEKLLMEAAEKTGKLAVAKLREPFMLADPAATAAMNTNGLEAAKAYAGGVSGNAEAGGVSPVATAYANMRLATSTTMGLMQVDATTFATNLQLVWTTLSQTMQATQASLNEALALGWTTMIEDANKQVDEWQTNWVEEKWPAWNEAMLALVDALKTGFMDRVGAMITDAQAAMDTFLAWLTNEDRLKAYSDAGYAVGEAIVEGILFAMESAVSDPNLSTRFESAANAIVAYVIRLLQAAADIASPSGLSASEVGGPLAEGIAVGMIDSAGVVSAATESVVAAAMDTGMGIADFGATATANAAACVCEQCIDESTTKIVAAIDSLKAVMSQAARGGSSGGGGGGGSSSGSGGSSSGSGGGGSSKDDDEQRNEDDVVITDKARAAAEAVLARINGAKDAEVAQATQALQKEIDKAAATQALQKAIDQATATQALQKAIDAATATQALQKAIDGAQATQALQGAIDSAAAPVAKQRLAETDLRVNNTTRNEYHLHMSVTPQTAERVEYSFAVLEAFTN